MGAIPRGAEHIHRIAACASRVSASPHTRHPFGRRVHDRALGRENGQATHWYPAGLTGGIPAPRPAMGLRNNFEPLCHGARQLDCRVVSCGMTGLAGVHNQVVREPSPPCHSRKSPIASGGLPTGQSCPSVAVVRRLRQRSGPGRRRDGCARLRRDESIASLPRSTDTPDQCDGRLSCETSLYEAGDWISPTRKYP